MRTQAKVVIAIAVLALTSNGASAQESTEARAAADRILSLLSGGKYQRVWDSEMSEFFKATMTRDSFLANMSIGRSQLGPLGNSKLVDQAYSESDPATGFQGKIYAFNYLNTYAVGKFYERIVVLREDDGRFRLAGLWGSPVPEQ